MPINVEGLLFIGENVGWACSDIEQMLREDLESEQDRIDFELEFTFELGYE